MRGEKMKEAVKHIEKHAYYATTGNACREALKTDTPEAYAAALEVAKNDGYLQTKLMAERALREDK